MNPWLAFLLGSWLGAFGMFAALALCGMARETAAPEPLELQVVACPLPGCHKIVSSHLIAAHMTVCAYRGDAARSNG